MVVNSLEVGPGQPLRDKVAGLDGQLPREMGLNESLCQMGLGQVTAKS